MTGWPLKKDGTGAIGTEINSGVASMPPKGPTRCFVPKRRRWWRWSTALANPESRERTVPEARQRVWHRLSRRGARDCEIARGFGLAWMSYGKMLPDHIRVSAQDIWAAACSDAAAQFEL